jgi:DNA-binding SARP family transcriptional activator
VTRWRFLVLGPLEVRRDGEVVALGGPKQRSVLATLLLHADQLVPAATLVDRVWGEESDEGSAASLQVYVSTLRKLLRDPVDGDESPERIAYLRPGYRIRLEPGELDLHELDVLVEEARRLRSERDLAATSHLLRLGLSMWRGPALADLADLPSMVPALVSVDRRREVLRHEAYEVELELGRHLALVPELEDAVAGSPLDETLVAQLVLALYRCGRQGEALAAYQRTADRLRDELGLEPSAPLRALHEAVLRQDLVLDAGLRSGSTADLATTMTPDGRGVRGATLSLPNGVELELGTRTWVLGRHPDCHVVLSDPEVSRRHAEVRPVRDGYDLVDLGSSNGTRVGDAEIVRHRLRPGDRLRLGSTELLYRAPGE